MRQVDDDGNDDDDDTNGYGFDFEGRIGREVGGLGVDPLGVMMFVVTVIIA